ncbi:MAG: bifunctional UDP-sugar hydrolase/5'-nucleotidase [Gemmatimonadales bacterium]
MLTPMILAASVLAPADSIVLRVLATTDFHGALEARVFPWSQGRMVGGIAALKALSDSLTAQCHCPVVRLNAGDQMQGTLGSNLVFGRSAIEALDLLPLDAAAIGNHDFDWGVDTLRARMAEADYPWLAANVIDSATGRRPEWVRASTIIETGGLRIGVIGYIAERTKQMVLAEHVAGLVFPRGRATFADELERLERAGVDLTILVAHEGAYCGESGCSGEIVDVARELDPSEVQLIVGGHTHSLVNTVVNGIPIVVARANSTALGVADLVRGDDGARRWRTRIEDVYVDRVIPDSQAAAMVARYRPEVDRLAHRVIATLGDELGTAGNEYPLGHLIADAQRAAARADVALMNNGGIRRPLLPGPLTYGDLFELQPFANFIVSLEVTGAQLGAIVEHTVSRGFPRYHISGAAVRYDPARPVGNRIVALRLADGRPVEAGERYTLAITNFLAAGGDSLPVVAGLEARRTDKTDIDALIEYLGTFPQPIRAVVERRYRSVGR